MIDVWTSVVSAVTGAASLLFFYSASVWRKRCLAAELRCEKIELAGQSLENEMKEALAAADAGEQARWEKLHAEVDQAISQARTHERRATELFAVVEQVLAERDQWRDMWHAHGREHVAAQAILEQALVDVRVALRNALVTINAYRRKEGQEPLPFGVEPGEKPVGSAAKFKAMLEQCIREAPEPTDGMSLRKQIVEDVP